MRVLIITPEYGSHGGGIATYYRLMAPALAAAGCEVVVVEGSGFEAFEASPSYRHAGVTVHRLEQARMAPMAEQFGHLEAAPVLRRMMAGAWAAWVQAEALGDFDVVEATDFGLMLLPPLMRQRAPVVAQMHGSFGQIAVRDRPVDAELDGGVSLALETAAAKLASALQTSSRSNADYWRQQTARETARVLPAWKPAAPRQHSASSRRIAVFGRIQQWKGPHIVCDALRLLPGAPAIDWYGRDVPHELHPSTSGWLQRAYPDVWGTRIHPRNQVSPDTVTAVQSAALLNLVPSTWDVFNFTAVEAMASGRPVLCSSAAGASELIEDGVTGFVYDGHSPTALAQALERALAMSPARLSEIGENARTDILAALDPRKIALERLAAYKALGAQNASDQERPDWLVRLSSPRQRGRNSLAFLDQLPMRSLAAYLAERAGRRRKRG